MTLEELRKTPQNFTLNGLINLLNIHRKEIDLAVERGFDVIEDPKIKIVAENICIEEYLRDPF